MTTEQYYNAQWFTATDMFSDFVFLSTNGLSVNFCFSLQALLCLDGYFFKLGLFSSCIKLLIYIVDRVH